MKYDAQLQELVWDIASTSVDNNDTSNEYLILSATKGNELGSITMNPKTSSNIRGGVVLEIVGLPQVVRMEKGRA